MNRYTVSVGTGYYGDIDDEETQLTMLINHTDKTTKSSRQNNMIPWNTNNYSFEDWFKTYHEDEVVIEFYE